MGTFRTVILELAASNMPILLLGEMGVGKHQIARQIHDVLSGEEKAPFVEVDCESTDETRIREALDVAGAEVRTIYFDRVDRMSGGPQRVLLAWLENKSGEARNARIIASGIGDFEDEVRQGRFREDLYYRLSGVCIRIPPLRHRKEDIADLADQYLAKYSEQFGRPKPAMTRSFLRFLRSHPWIGNFRELEEAMRTIVAVGNVEIAIAALESSTKALDSNRREKRNGTHIVSLKEAARAASQRAERELILKALTRTNWNRKKAAQELRISYKALLYKMKEMGSTPAL